MTLTLSKARLLAILVPLFTFAVYVHWYYGRFSALGEAAFLRHEQLRFETYYASDGNWGMSLFTAFFAVVVSIGLYELTALLLSRWLRR